MEWKVSCFHHCKESFSTKASLISHQLGLSRNTNATLRGKHRKESLVPRDHTLFWSAPRIATFRKDVQHQKSVMHWLSLSLSTCSESCDKSDWLRKGNDYPGRAQKTGPSRGHDSWCSPKVPWPLGTRMQKRMLRPLLTDFPLSAQQYINCPSYKNFHHYHTWQRQSSNTIVSMPRTSILETCSE